MPTMEFKEFQRLTFCNSRKLPRHVNWGGRLHEWVGIGWIDIGPEDAKHVTLVDSSEKPKRRRRCAKSPASRAN